MTHLARYPSLADRCVFVSGGATGIGATLVEAFALQGARVGFVDIDVEHARSLVERLSATAATAPLFVAADVTDTAALEAAIDAVAARFGSVRALLNNAANDQRHTMAETTPQGWDAHVAVNLKHQYFAARKVVPGMKAAGGGSIVNLGSITWKAKQHGLSVYATCKAAAQGLTRSLARELGPYRIRVNTLVPGWVMTDKQLRLWVDDAGRGEIARNQCLPDALQPQDIANMALFLAADDSAMCTAQDFVVDAGWT
jgi:NAD(P)-dependent dehydrogenase (short-subunit alcohol dehydrogenase family)